MIRMELTEIQESPGTFEYSALDGQERLGCCRFSLPLQELLFLSCQDSQVLDGLIRATAFYMMQKGIRGISVEKISDRRGLVSLGFLSDCTENILNPLSFSPRCKDCK